MDLDDFDGNEFDLQDDASWDGELPEVEWNESEARAIAVELSGRHCSDD